LSTTSSSAPGAVVIAAPAAASRLLPPHARRPLPATRSCPSARAARRHASREPHVGVEQALDARRLEAALADALGEAPVLLVLAALEAREALLDVLEGEPELAGALLGRAPLGGHGSGVALRLGLLDLTRQALALAP